MVVVIVVSPVTKRSTHALDVGNAGVWRASAVEHGCLLRTQATAHRPSMDDQKIGWLGSARKTVNSHVQILSSKTYSVNSVYKSRKTPPSERPLALGRCANQN